jgi:hypothetical protein
LRGICLDEGIKNHPEEKELATSPNRRNGGSGSSRDQKQEVKST